jgi:hypothetical protein
MLKTKIAFKVCSLIRKDTVSYFVGGVFNRDGLGITDSSHPG